MPYNSANAVLKGIKANFAKTNQSASADYKSEMSLIADRITSDQASEQFIVTSTVPWFKEWLDESPKIGDIKDWTVTVANKTWSRMLQVDRFVLSDSKKALGNEIESQVKILSRLYNLFPDRLINQELQDNNTAFDGTDLFSTARSNLEALGQAATCNLSTGTVAMGSDTTSTGITTDYMTGMALLRGFQDLNNNLFNLNNKIAILVPATYIHLFEKGFYNRYVDSAESAGLFREGVKIIANTQSTGNDWYLANVAAPTKAVLLTDRASFDWTMEDNKTKRHIDYVGTCRMGVGPGNPMSIVKINH
jgi:hypothetical protein